MDLPDVNVLIHAFRTDSPQHPACRSWLDRTFEARQPLAISRQTLASVVRITTNRRSFREASALDDALGFCDDILANHYCDLVEPGRRFWPIFANLLMTTQTTGPTVTNAWFAALAIEWNCEFVTLDRDFARFPGLRCKRPDG